MLAKQSTNVNPTHPCVINRSTGPVTIALPGGDIAPPPREWRVIDLERTPTGYRVIGEDEAKVICAWCDAHISGPRNATQVSHGICDKCAADNWPVTEQEWEQGQSPHPDGDWMLAGLPETHVAQVSEWQQYAVSQAEV